MLKRVTALLCLCLLSAPAVLPAQEDLGKIYSDASAQWLDGRPEDAAGALKYVVYRSSDQVLNAAALRDLAVLFAEAGKNGEALAYLLKGEVLSPGDFYIHFEKGWNLLSLEKYQDARAAFEKALTLTADQDLASQARFALGIAEAELGGPDAAIEELNSVYKRYPYLLSPLAQLISANLERLKKRPHAVNFIKEALTYDPRNIQAELDLARLYEEANFYVPAWQTYYTLSDMDPGEKRFIEKEKKLRKHVKGKIDNMLYWSRLAWPVHKDPLPPGRGPKVKVGLYAGKDGVPALVKGFSFIAATDFDLVDTRLGLITSGRGNMQWTVSYNEMNRIYEIRDSMGAKAHTTSNSLRIVPKTPGGVILIKSPDLAGIYGVNRGDKEVSGELLALVREKGFWLINETYPENMVSPIAAQLADGSRLPEHLKALAVAVRTRLALLTSLLSHESREYALCDSSHCLPFAGLQAENPPSAAAASETRGETLLAGAGLAPANFHRACGGFTRGGADDGGRALPRLTPFNLYTHTLKGPPDGLLCLSEDKTASSDVYWTLLLEPRWIEDRVNRTAKIGYIRAIIPLAREASGTLKAIRIDGTAGSTVVEGAGPIAAALGAGALRSTLFTIRPVFRGRSPAFFILRGIGTGEGDGLCVLGARGLAKARGAKYRDILKHYFPLYKVGLSTK
ncbi:MAG: tetratricopeptide repeat protein [Elusimicrobia bacterium]|nr:tetratricopeptide repeat protein [Elusimicrobiota bacterium]